MKREDRLNFIAQFIRENEIKTPSGGTGGRIAPL